MHYVPDLELSSMVPRQPMAKSAKTPRNPRHRRPQTSESLDLPITPLTLPRDVPQTARPVFYNPNAILAYRKPLPPLIETQDAVIPHLYSAVEKTSHFMAMRTDPGSLDLHIVPADYPKHLIGKDYAMLAITGAVKIEDKHASVVGLDQFVEDMAHEFIIERQMFRLRYAYRMYYTWRERYKERLFRKIIHGFDSLNAIAYNGFIQLMDKLRVDVLTITEEFSVYERGLDTKTEEIGFGDLSGTAEASIQNMSDVLVNLAGESARQIAEFFRQVRAVNLLMQLDFEELHSLNALPPALQPFAIDLKWKVPSIWRLRMREKQLQRERKLAALRQEYIIPFFTRVQMMYSGVLVIQCDRVIRTYLERFSSHCEIKRRINKIVTNFDPEAGITITPSREEYTKWVDRMVTSIKRAFLEDRKLLSDDIILDIHPEYTFEKTSLFDIMARFYEQRALTADVHATLDAAYSFVEKEVRHHASFMKEVIEHVNDAREFRDLRDVEKLGEMIGKLKEAGDDLRRRPKNIFHKMNDNGESTDFVVDMRSALEAGAKFLGDGVGELRSRLLNQLNNYLFTEIQEKWAAIKDRRISAADCRFLETRMVLYALLSQTVAAAWADMIGEFKASFETVGRMYGSLSDASRYIHADAILSFNTAADFLGIARVQVHDSDYEYDEEEEEEEEDAADATKPKPE
jgi:hypothetical protein